MSAAIADFQRFLNSKGFNLKVDGDYGGKTFDAAAEWFCTRRQLPVPHWMTFAASKISIHEIAGGKDHPFVVECHEAAGLPDEPDETPWCGSFCCRCMQAAQVPVHRGSASARSWEKFGREASKIEPPFGAVLTFARTGGSGRHVAFCAGYYGGYVFHLGGNQSNAVNVKAAEIETICASRWPS